MAKQTRSPIDPDLVKRMALLADTMLRTGTTNQEVHAALVKHGLSPESATSVIRALHRANRTRLRKRAQRDYLIGGGIMLVGTLISVLLATGVIVEPSGYAILATWCAMVIGGMLLGRGLMDRRTLRNLGDEAKNEPK